MEHASVELYQMREKSCAKGPRMAKSVDDRDRGARLARRDEGAYCWYVTEEQRSQPGCIGREGDRLSHSRALSQCLRRVAVAFVLLAAPAVSFFAGFGRGPLPDKPARAHRVRLILLAR